MKKILFLIAFVLIAFVSNAQVSCDGTYIVTEPKEGLKIKDCHVCIDEQHAEIFLFDKEVIVPITKTKHMNIDGICGNVYYIDEEYMSYIFYGSSEEMTLCMVSLISVGDRWTFVRTEHNK